MRIVVLAGQSNMAGRGNALSLPVYLNRVHEDIFYHYYCGFAADEAPPFSSSGWTCLQPGRKHNSTPAAHFGPELSFAVTFKKALGLANGELGIVKVAVGGTNLANDWNPVSPGGHKLFPKFVERMNDALSLVNIVRNSSKNTKDSEVIGILWMQGEGDSLEKDFADGYRDNLDVFIKKCRSFFNNDHLPFIQGQIMDRNRERMPFAPTVREAQYDLCGITPHTRLIETDDLPDLGDNIHFSSDALIELGNRYARVLAAMLQ